jgi:hypothetical protein
VNTYSVLSGQERLLLRNQLNSAFPIIQAVIEGAQEGMIFRNTRQDYWILHKAGFSEVFFNDDNGTELVDFILENDSLPNYFHIYNPPAELVDVFKTKSETFNIRERGRIQLQYKGQEKSNNLMSVLEDEFTISEVTQDNFDSLDIFNLDLANKFWNGKEDFVSNALGVFVKNKQNDPVSLCYAAAVADQKAEIDVVTLEPNRGKGLAKSMVNSFISKCNEGGKIPNWDCFDDNTASMNTARNLNFLLIKKYKFLSIFKNV